MSLESEGSSESLRLDGRLGSKESIWRTRGVWRACVESCVFSPRHTKIPETHYFVDFITGIIAFSRPLFQKVSRASAKFSRLSFPGFLRVKLQAIFKELCQGHFLFVTGEFKKFFYVGQKRVSGVFQIRQFFISLNFRVPFQFFSPFLIFFLIWRPFQFSDWFSISSRKFNFSTTGKVWPLSLFSPSLRFGSFVK